MTWRNPDFWRIDWYSGQAPSWYLVRHLSGDRACKIYGFRVFNVFIGILVRTKRLGMTPEQIAEADRIMGRSA